MGWARTTRAQADGIVMKFTKRSPVTTLRATPRRFSRANCAASKRKNNRCDGGRKDLLRKVDQLRRVIHAGDISGSQRRCKKTVEKQRELPGGRPDHDRSEKHPDLASSPGWRRSSIGRYLPMERNDGSCTSICAVNPKTRPDDQRVDPQP